MSAQRAKTLTLELWRYLVDHPNIGDVNFFAIPKRLFDKTGTNGWNNRPFCTYIGQTHQSCKDCPLQQCTGPGPVERWTWARDTKTRKKAAQEIVRAVENWEPPIHKEGAKT